MMSEIDSENIPVSRFRVIGQFLQDVLITVAVVVTVSSTAGLIWSVVRWMEVKPSPSAGDGALSAEGVMALMGPPGVLATVMMMLLGTLSAALLLYFWRQPASVVERAASARAVRRPGTWMWAGLGGVGLFVFATLASVVAALFGIVPAPSNQKMMLEAVSKYPVFIAIFAIVLAPAYEELLFRRVFFGRFRKAGFPVLGMLLSGVAFAFVHEIPALSANDWPAVCLLWLVYAMMGMVFALLYWKTETLWAAIMAHAINNAIALLLLVQQGLP